MVCPMATMTSRGGRPSKGPRKQLPARLPLAMATEIEERASALEISVTEYLVTVLGDHLASTPSPEKAQGELLPWDALEVQLNRSA